jgi:CheY-like chemotaxis protein
MIRLRPSVCFIFAMPNSLRPALSATPTRPRCVIVDDDPYFLKLTEVIVLKARPEFEITSFLDAVTALEFLSRERVDLIITDVRMPVMDGLQFTAAIRGNKSTIPIVVISSEDLGEDALAHGASVFLTKSVLTARLRVVIAELHLTPSGIPAEDTTHAAPLLPPASGRPETPPPKPTPPTDQTSRSG